MKQQWCCSGFTYKVCSHVYSSIIFLASLKACLCSLFPWLMWFLWLSKSKSFTFSFGMVLTTLLLLKILAVTVFASSLKTKAGHEAFLQLGRWQPSLLTELFSLTSPSLHFHQEGLVSSCAPSPGVVSLLFRWEVLGYILDMDNCIRLFSPCEEKNEAGFVPTSIEHWGFSKQV